MALVLNTNTRAKTVELSTSWTHSRFISSIGYHRQSSVSDSIVHINVAVNQL